MNTVHPAIIATTPIRHPASTIAVPRWALALVLIALVAVSASLATILIASKLHSPATGKPSTGRTHYQRSHPRFEFI